MNVNARHEHLLKCSVEQEKLINNLAYKSNPKIVEIMREEENWGEKSKKNTFEEMVESKKGKSKREDWISLKIHYKLGKKPKMELQGEYKKIKLPTYDGEFEEAKKACILNINKYYQVYDYLLNWKLNLLPTN